MKILEWLTNWKIVAATLIVLFVLIGPASLGVEWLGTVLVAIFLLLLVWFVGLVPFLLIRRGVTSTKGAISRISSKRQVTRGLLERLSDGTLTELEEDELDELAGSLGMPQHDLRRLREQVLQTEVQPLLRRIHRTKRYSPEDEEVLQASSEAHRLGGLFDDDVFLRYRQLWEIEETGTFEPTAIATDIRLAAKEECYLRAPAEWKQEKRIREHRGYVGGSLGFRVAKGVTLRVGRATPIYDEYDDVVVISDGALYVTNKKLLFVGTKKSTNITFRRIANYELFRNAIRIDKTSGKPDIFSLDEDDVQLLDAMLQVLG